MCTHDKILPLLYIRARMSYVLADCMHILTGNNLIEAISLCMF